MTSNSELADWIEWSLKQPNVIEVKNYMRPICANAQYDDQNLRFNDYLEWQYQIGGIIPLENLYVNVIGAAFIGRAKDVNLGWEAYKCFDGPDSSDAIGIPWWLANKLNIECDFANVLLSIHCGIFQETNHSAQTIIEQLRSGTVEDLN